MFYATMLFSFFSFTLHLIAQVVFIFYQHKILKLSEIDIPLLVQSSMAPTPHCPFKSKSANYSKILFGSSFLVQIGGLRLAFTSLLSSS